MEINDAKTKFQRSVAQHRLGVLSYFRKTPIVEIEKIPTERTKFPGTENDYWYSIKSDNFNETKCIYELGPKSIFFTHKHLSSKEIIKVLTEKSKVEWVNERGIYFAGYNDLLEAEANEKHALVNLSSITVVLEISWFPFMNGWRAEFHQEN